MYQFSIGVKPHVKKWRLGEPRASCACESPGSFYKICLLTGARLE